MKKLALLLLIPGFLSAADKGEAPQEDGFPLTLNGLAAEIYQLKQENRALQAKLAGKDGGFLQLVTARCTGSLTADSTFMSTLEAKTLASLSRDVVANLTTDADFMEAAAKQLAPHVDLADNVAHSLKETLPGVLIEDENFIGQVTAACTHRMTGDSLFVQALKAVEHEDTTEKAQGLRRRGSSIKEHGSVALKLTQDGKFLEMVGLILKGDAPFCEGIAEIIQTSVDGGESTGLTAGVAGPDYKAEMLKWDPEFVAAVAANVKALQPAGKSSRRVAMV
jgi:hypothetical protein